VLQCVAVCVCVLQYVTVCCSVLRHTTACCSVLQCVALSVLQCVAGYCSVIACDICICSVNTFVTTTCGHATARTQRQTTYTHTHTPKYTLIRTCARVRERMCAIYIVLCFEKNHAICLKSSLRALFGAKHTRKYMNMYTKCTYPRQPKWPKIGMAL